MLDVEDAAVVTFAPCGRVCEAGSVQFIDGDPPAGCRRVVMARSEVKALDWCDCDPFCWEVA